MNAPETDVGRQDPVAFLPQPMRPAHPRHQCPSVTTGRNLDPGRQALSNPALSFRHLAPGPCRCSFPPLLPPDPGCSEGAASGTCERLGKGLAEGSRDRPSLLLPASVSYVNQTVHQAVRQTNDQAIRQSGIDQGTAGR